MRYTRVLRYVDQVARTGSIRKAAERLNVTSTAVNRRIMDLETELGAALFERSARGVYPTAVGEMFIHFVRGQLAETDRLRARIDEMRGLKRGIVHVACSQAIAGNFMPEQLGHFRRRHPQVVLDVLALDNVQALAALRTAEVDLVLMFRPPPGAVMQPLFTTSQRLLALMAADHPLARRERLRLRDCAAYPVALPDASIGGRQLLDEAALRQELRLTPMVESNSLEFLRACAAKLGTISFQMEISVQPHDLPPGTVARPLDARDRLHADLTLAQLRGRQLSIAASTFAAFMIDALRAATGLAEA